MRVPHAARPMTDRQPTGSGVTTPQGFRAAGVSAGIKQPTPPERRPARSGAARLGRAGDRGGGVHDQPRAGRAGHRVARAPRAIATASARAIIVNSGCANACTGDDGHARRARHGRRDGAAASAARSNRCSWPRPASSACRCRFEKIRSGLPVAVAALGADQGAAAARAIMTTDPFPKEAAAQRDDRRPHGRASAAWPRAPA